MGTIPTRTELHREMEQLFGRVPEWVRTMPESFVPGFWALMRDFQMAETKLPNKTKELIGIGVAAATRCKYCTLFHTEAARLAGATEAEIAEAAAMAAMTMAGSTYLNAMQVDFDAFADETRAITQYVQAHLPPSEAHAPRH